MPAVAGLAWSCLKVVGPSISGIMTSMRMASGFSRAAFCDAGACRCWRCRMVPAGGGFEGEGGDFADVVFVVDDEDAMHEDKCNGSWWGWAA